MKKLLLSLAVAIGFSCGAAHAQGASFGFSNPVTPTQAGANAVLGPTAGATLSTGDLLYYDGTNWHRLPIGSTNNVLIVNSGIPAWGSSGGSGTVGAGIQYALPYYATAGTVLSGGGNISYNGGGQLSLGGNGANSGGVVLYGVTSGNCILQVKPVAGSSTNFTLPTTNGAASCPLISDGAGNYSSGVALTVPGGGTGLATITAHGVLTGEGTSSVAASAAGTTGQAFISGGASADGAYGVALPVGGGTGLSTITAHGVMIGEGTSAVAPTSAGTAGQVLMSNGASVDPTFQTAASGFGGNGADGALSVASGTTTLSGPLEKSYTTVSVTSTANLVCNGRGPFIINAIGTITLTSGSTSLGNLIGGGSPGGAGGTTTSSNVQSGASGLGCSGGQGGLGALSTIAGGGSGGGGSSTGGAGGGASGTTFATSVANAGTIPISVNGSGGGGGGVVGSGSPVGNGGAGGDGGITLAFISPAAINAVPSGGTQTCTLKGGPGGNATATTTCAAGGGAGGGGGYLWFISQTSVTTGVNLSVVLSGGNGGTPAATTGLGAGGAGGGGTGRAIIWAPAITNNMSISSVAGTGSAAAGTGGQAGANGGTAVTTALTITATPNLPLLGWMGLKRPTNIAESQTFGKGLVWLLNRDKCAISCRELARAYAHGDLNLYAKALTPGFDCDTTCLDNDAAEVLRNAS